MIGRHERLTPITRLRAMHNIKVRKREASPLPVENFMDGMTEGSKGSDLVPEYGSSLLKE